MRTSTSFFRWQEQALGWLLSWGIGSVVVGAGLATARRDLIRQFGLQAVAWGAIDAALAFNGRITACRKQSDPTTSPTKEAAKFQRIVAINAGLDVLYILGGLQLSRDRRGARQGMGRGIAIQGAFLLVYDLILTWQSGRMKDEA